MFLQNREKDYSLNYIRKILLKSYYSRVRLMTAIQKRVLARHKVKFKIGEKEMKKYIVTLANMPQNQIACINNHIAVSSLFEVGESITDNTLHSGKNIVDDKRVIDTLVWYKQHHQIGNDCISILEPLNV